MLQSKITRISFGIALTLIVLMWAVFLPDYILHLDLYKYGLYPRKASGLIGIITAPFLHSTTDFTHIINNSIPTFVLSWLLFYHYRIIAMRSFLFIYLFTGITMWLFAGKGYHIGMSGIIYGLTSFLVFSGFFRKNMRVAAISLVVIFLYGSTVWGIFPGRLGVSWEAHAFGLIGGIAIAFYYRKNGPQPAKMMYEIEEELGIEPTEEYWKFPQNQPAQNQPRIINYEIVPKSVQVEKPNDKTKDDSTESAGV